MTELLSKTHNFGFQEHLKYMPHPNQPSYLESFLLSSVPLLDLIPDEVVEPESWSVFFNPALASDPSIVVSHGLVRMRQRCLGDGAVK